MAAGKPPAAGPLIVRHPRARWIGALRWPVAAGDTYVPTRQLTLAGTNIKAMDGGLHFPAANVRRQKKKKTFFVWPFFGFGTRQLWNLLRSARRNVVGRAPPPFFTCDLGHQQGLFLGLPSCLRFLLLSHHPFFDLA